MPKDGAMSINLYSKKKHGSGLHSNINASKVFSNIKI